MIVTASTIASLVLDHWGLMGFEVHKAGIGRIVGALLMARGSPPSPPSDTAALTDRANPP